MSEATYNTYIETLETTVPSEDLPRLHKAKELGYEGFCDYVRNERNDLLSETDWWAVSDLTMTAEQTAYRQALRDVPTQDTFPDTVTWPTKP